MGLTEVPMTTGEPGTHWWQRRVAVRTRITLSVAALAALAMLLVGGLLNWLGTASMYRDEAGDTDREFQEFVRSQEGTADVVAGLEKFLRHNVPDDDELHVGYVGGEPSRYVVGANQAASGEWDAFLRSPAYTSALERVLTVGGREGFDDPMYGEAWVSALPLRGESVGPGTALVIVTFLADERSELAQTLWLYSVTSLGALALVTLLAWVQAGRLLVPIRLLRVTAEEISATDVSRRIPERGNDDLTDLTRTVNAMLNRLEGGLEEQRRFLDDVSHELRTPLTIIAGHLELLDPERPEEVRATRDLVLDETDRMSRLVGDLALLAKSRRPDFIAPQPTDLVELTRSIYEKAVALGDRRWRLESTVTGVALLDEQRIAQAILQLLDNAVKHTDPGQSITLGASRGADTITFWVRDHGDGIAAADREWIFERFARGAARPGDPGFGLGLSIVHAIVTAHGGSVDVESDPGEHTEFRITLPTGGVLTAPKPPASDARADGHADARGGRVQDTVR